MPVKCEPCLEKQLKIQKEEIKVRNLKARLHLDHKPDLPMAFHFRGETIARLNTDNRFDFDREGVHMPVYDADTVEILGRWLLDVAREMKGNYVFRERVIEL